jgi:DNA-binding SARP family transcriptional activator
MLLLPHRPPATATIASGQLSTPASISATVDRSLISFIPTSTALEQPPKDNRIPYVVQRGETLWGVAEAHVGNGLAWRQITDANGRSFDTGIDDWVQVNGRMIYEREARLIFSGETIYLPAAWAPTGPAPVTEPIKGPPPASTNPAAGDPIHTPIQSESSGADTPSTSFGPPPSFNGYGAKTRTAEPRGQSPAEVAGLLGAGMVAGAVLSTLNRMRACQSRYRRPDRRIPLPTGDLAGVEMELRAAERPDLIAATHKALHALASDLDRGGLAAPTICGVIAGDDRIEVMLDRPGTPPAPWKTHDAYCWSLPTERIPSEAGTGIEPLPCLLPIGRLPGSAAEVLINLAAAGMVHVWGDARRAAALIHAAALSFTGLPWAGSAEVLLVGGTDGLHGAAVQVRAFRSLDAVIDELEARVIDLRETFGDRLNCGVDRPEGWLPTVVLLDGNGTSESVDRLVSLCSSGGGVCAIIASSSGGPGWILDVDSVPALLPELRLAVELISPPQEWTDAIDQLVSLATGAADIGADDPPYDRLESGTKTLVSIPPEPVEPGVGEASGGEPYATTAPARISVLGPVTYDGIDDFFRPRSFEIALYLALHPEGVSEGRLDEMIWPAKTEVLKSTRDQAISAARTALGGRARFPIAHGQGRDKTHRLRDQVNTDWREFCDFYRLGRQTNSIEHLRSALQLVRGRPFGDLDAGPGFQWLHLEGHIYHMQAEIADAADLAAGLYLDSGRPLDARWAANQGLLSGPYTERLWVRLMAAADALGEAQEVERLLVEMDSRLGLDGDYGQLHPDTISAYRIYSRQRATPRT